MKTNPIALQSPSDAQRQLDAQAAQIADLQKKLASVPDLPAADDNSTLAILCRAHGVSMKDCRWRIAAGLDEEQAVQAALAQKKSDKAAEIRAQVAKAAQVVA